MQSVTNTQPVQTGWTQSLSSAKEKVGDFCNRRITAIKEWKDSPNGHRVQSVASAILAGLSAGLFVFSSAGALVAGSFAVVSLTLGLPGPAGLSLFLAASKALVAYSAYRWGNEWATTAKNHFEQAKSPSIDDLELA